MRDHSPGPWQPSRFVDSRRYAHMPESWKRERQMEEARNVRGPGRVGDGDCNIVARCMDERDVPVVSAAPDLLAAAKQVLAGMDAEIGQRAVDTNFPLLRAAVAKASPPPPSIREQE